VANICLLFSLYSQFDKQGADKVMSHKFDKSIFTPLLIVLARAYFIESVGMVVQTTFFPDIVNSLPGLACYPGYAWLAVDLAGIPSYIIWTRLAHRFNSIDIMMVAIAL